MLPEALSATRTLINRTFNETAHERFLKFARIDSTRSDSGIEPWITPGHRALLKRHVRTKDEPLVSEVTIVEALSPKVIRIRHSDGRVDTVSSSSLAKAPGTFQQGPPVTRADLDNSVARHCSDTSTEKPNEVTPENEQIEIESTDEQTAEEPLSTTEAQIVPEGVITSCTTPYTDPYAFQPRRSGRDKRTPAYFRDYVHGGEM